MPAPEPLTDAEWADLARLLNEATPGPWGADEWALFGPNDAPLFDIIEAAEADARLIVMLRNNASALLAERAKRETAEARLALLAQPKEPCHE